MGTSTSIKAISCCNSCIISLGEPFSPGDRLAHPEGAKNATFFTNGTFIGGTPYKMIRKFMKKKNFKMIRRFMKNFNGDALLEKMLSQDFFPKNANGVLDWFIQVHDKLSRVHAEFS